MAQKRTDAEIALEYVNRAIEVEQRASKRGNPLPFGVFIRLLEVRDKLSKVTPEPPFNHALYCAKKLSWGKTSNGWNSNCFKAAYRYRGFDETILIKKRHDGSWAVDEPYHFRRDGSARNKFRTRVSAAAAAIKSIHDYWNELDDEAELEIK